MYGKYVWAGYLYLTNMHDGLMAIFHAQTLWRFTLFNFLDPLGISLCTLCSKDWTDKTIPSLSPVAPNQCFIKGWGVEFEGGGEEVALGIPPPSPVFQ